MNAHVFSRRTIAARFYAVLTIVALLLSAFPASFFVAEAATNLSGPDSATFTSGGDTSYESAAFDATGFDTLEFIFDFAGPTADPNDTIEYGWKRTSDATENLLGEKTFSNGTPPADSGAVSVGLPGGAAVPDLIVFIRVKAGSNFTSDDEIALTNIVVVGDNYPVAPDGTINTPETAYGNPQDNVRICHYDSESGTYSNPDQSVDISSIVNGTGHGGHLEDIIPPFWYNLNDAVELFEGSDNWDTDSQAIYNNDCVVAPTTASVTIEKIAGGDTTTEFDFTGGLGDFTITQGSGHTVDDLKPGEYTITETVTEGWQLLDITCNDVQMNGSIPSVSLDLVAGDDVTCIFTNRPTQEPPEVCEPERHVFADNAVEDDQGLTKGGVAVDAGRSNPADATGDPDWSDGKSDGFYSLGFGGWIVVSFDRFVVNVDGDDLSVHEATNGNNYPLETAKVEVSQTGNSDDWHELSEEARNDNNEGGDNVTLLDFDETGLDWIKYVRLTDTTDPAPHNNAADGFDVDTVDATYVVCDEPEPDPEMIAIHTYKVECTEEEDLPNWNTNPANGAPTITGDTAADWVAEHESCELVEGWEFQWAPYGTSNPGDTLYGAAGGAWSSPFTGTTNILLSDLEGQNKLWMREVLEEGYIPFTFNPEGKKNTDNVTAEFYCHIDGLNYDNYDRIDGVKAESEYYCVAWNSPIEPDEPSVTYGDYCGDGVVNQEWEQCDGAEGCTDYCTNQCSELPLVRITLDEQAPESASFDGMIYLGSSANPIPNGTWFLFAEPGDDDVTATALGSTGLAVERAPGALAIAVDGSNPNSPSYIDYAFGTIETKGLLLGDITDPVPGWVLENSGVYEDDADVLPDDMSATFEFRTGPAKDLAVFEVLPGEPYDCPDCDAEVEARVVLQDGEEIMKNGDGNLLPQVILGDGTTVPFGTWFKVSEANPGPSAVWIDDVDTVTNFPNPADLEGLFVSREGNGQVKVALYGFHNPGGDVNYESLRATIEFNDAKVASAAQIPGNFKLENHSEADAVNSNDNFDSFAVAGDNMSVNFDFWVDTAADGITITLDEDTIATCDEDTDPRDPDPDPETYVISGYKHEMGDDYIGFLSGWTISIDNGDDIQMSTQTDVTGYYSFEVPAGTYEVSETMQTDWLQVEVRQDGVLVETDADVEECSFIIPDESDYECDFYNEYVGGSDTPDDNDGGDGDNGGDDEEGRTYTSGTRIARPMPLVLGESISQCPFLEDFMQMGWDNDSWEVTKLQMFLNIFKDLFGGTANPVTGVFDSTTDANVKAFQQFFKGEVLDPWYTHGIVPHSNPTGFVYKTTLWKINDIVCPEYAIEPDFTGEDLNSNVDIR